MTLIAAHFKFINKELHILIYYQINLYQIWSCLYEKFVLKHIEPSALGKYSQSNLDLNFNYFIWTHELICNAGVINPVILDTLSGMFYMFPCFNATDWH